MKTAEETLNDIYSHEEINDLKSKGLFYAMINQMNEFAKQSSKNISIYNLSHNEIDDNCCGIFDRVDEEGMIICNECNVKMRDIILENLKDTSKPKIEDDKLQSLANFLGEQEIKLKKILAGEIKDDVFGELCKPLMKYLAENHHPHTKIILESNTAELVEGINCIHTDEFLVD